MRKSNKNRRFPGGPRVRRPDVRIVKRNGRIEPFNRTKMIRSLRNSGATPQEANLVTNRVATRMEPRGTISSKEVSGMVARSLSHVNPTASRAYTRNRDQRLSYNNRLNHLSSAIADINRRVNSSTARIESLDNRIQSLPGRLARIRQRNFRVFTHLDTDQADLSKEWAKLSPELLSTVSLKGEIVRRQVSELQKALSYRAGSGDYNQGNLHGVEAGISQARLQLSEIQNSIFGVVSPLEKKLENIESDLARAESTLALVEGASFLWEEGENPVLAFRAKDLNNDLEGFIILTNLKFVFEHEKEIVLKKRLFVVTEKKVVREVMIQKPIGMVTELSEGKVGFFKGSGLFIKFAPETGIPEMKFDTTGQDAKWATSTYKYIISGQAEKELSATTPTETTEKAPQLIICPICGAPYNDKIYRGQTSINCEYCGTAISV